MNAAAIAFLHQHLLAALQPAPTETRRLFHGRGRCYPGLEHLTVDWLQGVLLVALFRQPEFFCCRAQGRGCTLSACVCSGPLFFAPAERRSLGCAGRPR